MFCPFCRHSDSRVVDSRVTDDGTAIRRRRSCPECGRRFTTLETASISVVKRSGVTEPFSRAKVIAGVRKACQGRPVDEDALAFLAQRVEDDLRASGCSEIASQDVGLAVLAPLRELDDVAYLRFASVYRSFETLADFEAEIALQRAELDLQRDSDDIAERLPRGARKALAGNPKRTPPGEIRQPMAVLHSVEEIGMTETTRDTQSGSSEPQISRKGLTIERVYSKPGVHPYDEVTWERRDVVMTNWRDGTINFEQRGVEFPDFWSVNAANIVTTKYFRGAVGTEQREWSLKQLIDRVVLTYVKAGQVNGYFATVDDATIFEHELTYALLHQVFSFNSPVWFNVGTSAPQQVSACFILAVDDKMDSILDWYKEEGMIFKGGSGSGVNLSRIRSSKELLSSGGTASGPVSFMRGADASAGTIKSGGATRRAAKMVILDVDHPDIEEFIETKSREEDKIRVLRDAGYDMDLGGRDMSSVQYQNANNSVRVNEEFMRAFEQGNDFGLKARTDGSVIETVDAKKLMRKMAQAAWECADPGIQYDDTINDWHTTPETGRITASNPCSEYMHLDNSSCNLASLNLMKFLKDDDSFDAVTFAKVVEFVITAMDISICFADFPTEKIGDTTRKFRQLGIGYANLGALLMATGHAYDSDSGRALAAGITSLMTGTAYKRSAELAGIVGPYDGLRPQRRGAHPCHAQARRGKRRDPQRRHHRPRSRSAGDQVVARRPEDR